MAQSKSVRVDKRQREAMKDMVESGLADDASDAHRALIDAGMQAYGYENGERVGPSPMPWLARELGKWFAIVGMAFMAFTLFYPVQIRLWVVFFAFGSVTCYAVAHFLESDVSHGLRAWWGESV